MSEQELQNLRGVEDHLIADVASHIPDEIFCLVVPTNGANCCLLDSQSLRIVRHQPGSKDLQNKQGTNVNVSLAVVYFSHTFLLLFLPYL